MPFPQVVAERRADVYRDYPAADGYWYGDFNLTLRNEVSADPGGGSFMSPVTGSEGTNTAVDTFDAAVEAFRAALEVFVTGDPGPALQKFSRREDVTLANPLGPPVRGREEVEKAASVGAAQLRDGSVRGFEEISRYSTADLGYVVQIERTQAVMPESDEKKPIALRVTLIFRREEDGWKIVHRHADPITTPRSITTSIET